MSASIRCRPSVRKAQSSTSATASLREAAAPVVGAQRIADLGAAMARVDAEQRAGADHAVVVARGDHPVEQRALLERPRAFRRSAPAPRRAWSSAAGSSSASPPDRRTARTARRRRRCAVRAGARRLPCSCGNAGRPASVAAMSMRAVMAHRRGHGAVLACPATETACHDRPSPPHQDPRHPRPGHRRAGRARRAARAPASTWCA